MTRILYVDDNDDNVYTLKLRFGLLEWRRSTVKRGAQWRLRSNFDIIIMHPDVPVGAQTEATRRLKFNPSDQSYSAHAKGRLQLRVDGIGRQRDILTGCLPALVLRPERAD